MKVYLLILPVALLVAYSQIIVKWRVGAPAFVATNNSSANALERIFTYLADPIILSAYAAAFLASFAWLFVVTKLPLSIAFPIYIGVTFAMVLLGGWFFLEELITLPKLVAISLIFSGIVVGVRG